MQAGQINEEGVRNLQRLQALINDQSVPYDFGFYQVDFKTDTPTLVTCHGKPVLEMHTVVRVQPDAAHAAHLHALAGLQGGPAAEEADALSRAFAGMARCTDVELSEAVCKLAEERYVAQRQASPKTTNEISLARWLTVARVLAASHGQAAVSIPLWERAMQLEDSRAERAAAVAAAAAAAQPTPLEGIAEE